jgi:signal transduction histidine kinase
MKIFDSERIRNLFGLLATGRPEPVQQAERIVKMLRDVVLPAKAGVCLVVLYYLFYSGWLSNEQTNGQTMPSVALDTLKDYFLIYLLCNFVGAILFVSWRRLPPGTIQWLAFILGLLDGVFMGGMTIATGGFASIAFWVFPGLIVLNALTIPLAMPQIALNLLLSAFYLGAVLLTPQIGWENINSDAEALANLGLQYTHAPRPAGTNHPAAGTGEGATRGTNQNARAETLARLSRAISRSNADHDNAADDIIPEQLVARLAVLWLLTICCYGAQLLQERQRQAVREAAEFAAREGQLHSAGRLAAEFAHQIKNPLAIINNAAYSLQRSLDGNKSSAAQQIEIIQEEVARADKVITQIMGYAQLSEGRVEKLKVAEEIERAIEQVFPSAVPTTIKVRKKFHGSLPALVMQRGHLAEILVNLLLNAREAGGGPGNVSIAAAYNRHDEVEITVADDGPGIPPDKVERIFEPYFTTKEKGTGLGLAIVKHNAELYGGAVRVESVLGKGAKFTVTLPATLQLKPFVQ